MTKKLSCDTKNEPIVCFEPFSADAANYPAFQNVESAAEFYAAKADYTKSVLLRFVERGVEFVSFDGVIISPFARIGRGTVIYPNVQIRSGVTVGEDCIIGSGTIIESSDIGDRCNLNAVQVYGSVVEDDVTIGPFSHVRPGCRIRKGVKIGDFVEIKNSDIGESSSAAHLTYIGDSDVGKRVNLGCGSITVNYDGISKARTVIEDDAFIGCNTNLIAPVRIGAGAVTAAGSTVVHDVEPDALAIARAPQLDKPGWRKRRKKK